MMSRANAKAQKEQEGRLKALLDFSARLQEKLQNTTGPIEDLARELLKRLDALPQNVKGEYIAQFDQRGTELWNIAMRLARRPNALSPTSLLMLRIFAFGLIDTAHDNDSVDVAKHIRVLKIAHIAVRACLDAGEEANAMKLMTRAAHLLQLIGQQKARFKPDEQPVVERLNAEHGILRVALAWKQANLDVAEFAFGNLATSFRVLSSDTLEQLVEVLHGIGKDLYGQKKFVEAVVWLQRAFDTLTDDQLQETPAELRRELKLAVAQTLVSCLRKSPDPQATQQARDLLSVLNEQHSGEIVVCMLEIELLGDEASPDVSEYHGQLCTLVGSVKITAVNFKVITHHIHKLAKFDNERAISALDQLTTQRLLHKEDLALREKAVVLRLWLTTVPNDLMFVTLRRNLDFLLEQTHTTFGAEAAYASQALIWKHIEDNFAINQSTKAETWCQIAMHRIFERGGPNNHAKIVRKLVACMLARDDYAAARETLFQMSETTLADPKTRYLAYKVALRVEDTNLAASSLDVICRESMKDPCLLYACVLEAQSAGDKRQTIIAFQSLLQRTGYSAHEDVRFPVLLRLTAKLLRSEIPRNQVPDNDLLESLCKIYESAATEATKQHQKDGAPTGLKQFTREEVIWFCSSSWNLVLDFCAEIGQGFTLRLAEACYQLLSISTDQASADQKERQTMQYRSCLCNVIATSAAVVLARAEATQSTSQGRWLEVRLLAQRGRKQITTTLIYQTSESTRNELQSKFLESLKFDIEACLKLEAWADLIPLYRETWKFDNLKQRWETLADLAIIICEELSVRMKNMSDSGEDQDMDVDDDDSGTASDAQALQDCLNQSLNFLKTIIDKTWTSTGELPRLCKWLRCLFQLILDTHSPIRNHSKGEDLALAVIRQATTIAGANPATFPASELEWLAASAFNIAVDAFNSEIGKDSVEKWANVAIDLAEKAQDRGAFADVLRVSYGRMSVEDRGS